MTFPAGFTESDPTPSSIRCVTGRVSHRIAEATRQALSLEGLVIALIGGGVWLAASAILAQVTTFETAASVLVGAGVGLVAVAGFIWRVVMPKRAGEQHGTDVLKHEARKHLTTLAAEGVGSGRASPSSTRRNHGGGPSGSGRPTRSSWMRSEDRRQTSSRPRTNPLARSRCSTS